MMQDSPRTGHAPVLPRLRSATPVSLRFWRLVGAAKVTAGAQALVCTCTGATLCGHGRGGAGPARPRRPVPCLVFAHRSDNTYRSTVPLGVALVLASTLYTLPG